MTRPYWTLTLASLVAAVFLCARDSAHAAQISTVAYRPASESSALPAIRRAAPAKPPIRRAWVRPTPSKPSYGQQQGLHALGDPLELRSSVALVVDQDTNEVLLSKNPQAVLPIASITKLMTALVVAEARQPLGEMLTISQDDVDTEKGSQSRLRVGTRLTRGELLHLALMASENRAAHALGRNYPGGMGAFVAAMNQRAQALSMNETRYVEPTGLSSANQSSARDLASLVNVAYSQPLLRELSTSRQAAVAVGRRKVQYHNTNTLVRDPQWDIGLQKTGYISEAGRCLVMQARLAGRQLIMVLLDSAGKYSRIGDAERIRRWLKLAPVPAAPSAAPIAIAAPVVRAAMPDSEVLEVQKLPEAPAVVAPVQGPGQPEEAAAPAAPFEATAGE